jgi:hypothetical protein
MLTSAPSLSNNNRTASSLPCAAATTSGSALVTRMPRLAHRRSRLISPTTQAWTIIASETVSLASALILLALGAGLGLLLLLLLLLSLLLLLLEDEVVLVVLPAASGEARSAAQTSASMPSKSSSL